MTKRTPLKPIPGKDESETDLLNAYIRQRMRTATCTSCVSACKCRCRCGMFTPTNAFYIDARQEFAKKRRSK